MTRKELDAKFKQAIDASTAGAVAAERERIAKWLTQRSNCYSRGMNPYWEIVGFCFPPKAIKALADAIRNGEHVAAGEEAGK